MPHRRKQKIPKDFWAQQYIFGTRSATAKRGVNFCKEKPLVWAVFLPMFSRLSSDSLSGAPNSECAKPRRSNKPSSSKVRSPPPPGDHPSPKTFFGSPPTFASVWDPSEPPPLAGQPLASMDICSRGVSLTLANVWSAPAFCLLWFERKPKGGFV